MESLLHTLSAFCISGCLFNILGKQAGLLAVLIDKCPDPFFGVFGQWPKNFVLTSSFFILCLMGSAIVKYFFYKIVGALLGLEPTTPMDDFWLYDFPINPIVVPSALVIDRISKDHGTPEE
jgi:hypothetical protein